MAEMGTTYLFKLLIPQIVSIFSLSSSNNRLVDCHIV